MLCRAVTALVAGRHWQHSDSPSPEILARVGGLPAQIIGYEMEENWSYCSAARGSNSFKSNSRNTCRVLGECRIDCSAAQASELPCPLDRTAARVTHLQSLRSRAVSRPCRLLLDVKCLYVSLVLFYRVSASALSRDSRPLFSKPEVVVQEHKKRGGALEFVFQFGFISAVHHPQQAARWRQVHHCWPCWRETLTRTDCKS